MNKEKARIQNMFDSIATHYDFLNHFLSAGIDRSWRRKLVKQVSGYCPTQILDVATGTADVAILMAQQNPQAVIRAVDLSSEMLKVGQGKIEKLRLTAQISLAQEDACQMSFADESFDVVTASFGVRNFEHLSEGLSQMRRVTRTGGTLCILEFSMPTQPLLLVLYKFYFARILPILGKSISKDKGAYAYLFKSASQFPHGEAFLQILRSVGFEQVKARPLSGGIASLYTAIK